MKHTCNKDCFNCFYASCINDKLDFEDYVWAKKVDKAIERMDDTVSDRKRIERYRRFYQNHKEEIKEKEAKYRAEHKNKRRETKQNWVDNNREYINAHNRKRYAENMNGCRDKQLSMAKEYKKNNKEKVASYNREYYQKNRERLNAYRRELRRRKKMEGERMNGETGMQP